LYYVDQKRGSLDYTISKCSCVLKQLPENKYVSMTAAGDSKLQVLMAAQRHLALPGHNVLLMCCSCFDVMALRPAHISP